MTIHTLRVTWGTSRGRDTYGYNICTVTDMQTRKQYRCMGGGYDMLGTSFAKWLQEQYQTALVLICERAHYVRVGDQPTERRESGVYGMSTLYTAKLTSCRVVLDGACGLESILTIGKEIGLDIRRETDKRGNTVGFVVTAPDKPEDIACDACGSPAGEPCNPFCIGLASHLDGAS